MAFEEFVPFLVHCSLLLNAECALRLLRLLLLMRLRALEIFISDIVIDHIIGSGYDVIGFASLYANDIGAYSASMLMCFYTRCCDPYYGEQTDLQVS